MQVDVVEKMRCFFFFFVCFCFVFPWWLMQGAAAPAHLTAGLVTDRLSQDSQGLLKEWIILKVLQFDAEPVQAEHDRLIFTSNRVMHVQSWLAERTDIGTQGLGVSPTPKDSCRLGRLGFCSLSASFAECCGFPKAVWSRKKRNFGMKNQPRCCEEYTSISQNIGDSKMCFIWWKGTSCMCFCAYTYMYQEPVVVMCLCGTLWSIPCAGVPQFWCSQVWVDICQANTGKRYASVLVLLGYFLHFSLFSSLTLL